MLTLVSALPQVISLLRTKDRRGISSWTYTIWALTSMGWCAWSLHVGAVPSAAVNALCVPILTTVVVLLRPSRTQTLLLLTGPLVCFGLGLLYVPALAAAASVLQVVSTLPSAKLAIQRTTDLSGVSSGTWALMAAASACWIAYDIGIGYALAGAATVLTLVCSIVIAVKARTYQHPTSPAFSTTTELAPAT